MTFVNDYHRRRMERYALHVDECAECFAATGRCERGTSLWQQARAARWITWPTQVACPSCGGVVLTPLVKTKTHLWRSTTCCWCDQPVDLLIGNQEVSVWAGVIVVPRPQRVTVLVGASDWAGTTGVHGTTDVCLARIDQVWVARMGFAMMGSVNNDASVGACPFDPLFHDNFIQAVSGASGEQRDRELFEGLKREMHSMADSLWA